MRVPDQVPGLKWLTIIVSIYAIIWVSLEGDLRQVLFLSAGVIVLIAGYFVQKFLAGRTFGLLSWMGVCTGAGVILGLTFGVLTLAFMAIKTGLHGHGPEFNPDEVAWVIRQIPFWGMIGLLAGAGLGALAAGFSTRAQ